MTRSLFKTVPLLLCSLSLLLLCACGSPAAAPAASPAAEATEPAQSAAPTPAAATPIPVDSIPVPTTDPADAAAAQDNPFRELDQELAEVKAKALALEEEITTADLTQTEYNEKAAELYALWDSELNVLWKNLQEKLSSEAMKELTEEESEWVQGRDQQMKAAAAEYEGGSIYPMIYSSAGAQLTEERVYQLYDYLRYGF